MNSLRTAIVVSVGLIVALWWAVLPPRLNARPQPPIETQKQQQCPPGARLEGKTCVCPIGARWTGSACTGVA